MTTTKEKRRAEDTAHQVTVTGWACKVCGHFWGDSEHMARYCHAETFPCECGVGRYEKHWACCKTCRDKKADEKWFAKEEHEWDGVFPICLDDDDRFFFDEDDLIEYLCESIKSEGESTDAQLFAAMGDLRLVSCKPNKGRHFEMIDHLCDDLPEDGELDWDGINKTVNDWIESQGVLSWWPSGNRLSIESVAKQIGILK